MNYGSVGTVNFTCDIYTKDSLHGVCLRQQLITCMLISLSLSPCTRFFDHLPNLIGNMFPMAFIANMYLLPVTVHNDLTSLLRVFIALQTSC